MITLIGNVAVGRSLRGKNDSQTHQQKEADTRIGIPASSRVVGPRGFEPPTF